jgi:hypothetical protein
MTLEARFEQVELKYAELVLAAITAEAHQGRLNDQAFRSYVKELTESLDLPKARA